MNLSNLVSDPTKLQTFGKYISADDAFMVLKRGIPATPTLIQAVASDPWYAYRYARFVIKGRFPEGEAAIATDAWYSYEYAYEIIKGRFLEGEATIATDATTAYLYARYVIRDRFPEGEASIYTNAHISRSYVNLITTFTTL